jgi:hypothetical protein
VWYAAGWLGLGCITWRWLHVSGEAGFSAPFLHLLLLPLLNFLAFVLLGILELVLQLPLRPFVLRR